MAKKMSKAMALRRVDEARSKLLRVMRFADLTPKESTDLFKLSNEIHRFGTKLKK